MPKVGARASISHFGGLAESAVIVAIREEGRRVVVRDEAQELREFTLRRATAAFVLDGEQHSPRLRLV